MLALKWIDLARHCLFYPRILLHPNCSIPKFYTRTVLHPNCSTSESFAVLFSSLMKHAQSLSFCDDTNCDCAGSEMYCLGEILFVLGTRAILHRNCSTLESFAVVFSSLMKQTKSSAFCESTKCDCAGFEIHCLAQTLSVLSTNSSTPELFYTRIFC